MTTRRGFLGSLLAGLAAGLLPRLGLSKGLPDELLEVLDQTWSIAQGGRWNLITMHLAPFSNELHAGDILEFTQHGRAPERYQVVHIHEDGGVDVIPYERFIDGRFKA